MIALLIAGALAAAADWPQWRGPGRDGAVASFEAPRAWPKSLKLKWKVPAGEGHSSPVVSGGRIYVHTRQGEQEVVAALEFATGKVVWRDSYAAPFTKNQYAVRHPKGPHSTPLLRDGRLYTLGIGATLSCYDTAAGRLIWRKDSKELIERRSALVDTSKLFTGTAGSPMIEGGLLIAHLGDDRGGEIVALDAATGQKRWGWRGDGPGYASPIVADLEGMRQVVTLTDKSVVGVAAASGELLWRLPYPDEWNENIVTPVVHRGRLILSGVRKPTVAVRLLRRGKEWTTETVWQNPDLSMYMSTPLLDGDVLYGFSSKKKGMFFGLDARTGKTLWSTAGRDAEHATVLGAGPWLVVLTTGGELIFAPKSANGFQPAARYTVADSPTWAHPVLAGREILVKDASSLALWSVE